ncbi:hypothetical protein Tco_0777510, partial [Tanacetum coccineum]
MNRIEDVLYADRVAQDPSLLAKKRKMSSRVPLEESNSQKISGQTPTGSTTSMTLSDFMGWSGEQETTSSSPKSEDKETEKQQRKEERVRLLVGSPGTSPIYSPGSSSTPIYSLGASRDAECSNCKHLLDKITVLEAIIEMYKNPEQSTLNSAALFHEVYNDMGKLDLEQFVIWNVI